MGQHSSAPDSPGREKGVDGKPPGGGRAAALPGHWPRAAHGYRAEPPSPMSRIPCP